MDIYEKNRIKEDAYREVYAYPLPTKVTQESLEQAKNILQEDEEYFNTYIRRRCGNISVGDIITLELDRMAVAKLEHDYKRAYKCAIRAIMWLNRFADAMDDELIRRARYAKGD
jgi:uncharacterized membrane protein (UPF0182 family)